MSQEFNKDMTSNKPYLIRAMYEWINDNEFTPYLYVDIDIPGVLLPDNLMHATPQVLNISATACQNLMINNDSVVFQARFSGKVFDVFVPVGAIVAIVATENGQGLTFDTGADDSDVIDDDTADSSSSDNTTQPSTIRKKSTLKIVK